MIYEAKCDICGKFDETGEITCVAKRVCVDCAAKIFNTTPEKIKVEWEKTKLENKN